MSYTDAAMKVIEALQEEAEKESPDERWKRDPLNYNTSNRARYSWDQGRSSLARTILANAGIRWKTQKEDKQ